MSAATEPLLRVSGLRRHFGGGRSFLRTQRTIRAVEDVSLTLRIGETLGLVGESGCGKSTTGRIIVGLERPSGGEILFKGRDLTSLTPNDWQRQRRDIQMIFQNPQSALDPRLSIGRQIREPLDLHAIGERSGRDAEVARLMQAVALAPEMADRFPHQISGGQAQRVVIARALAMKPSLIVCDEPVSALDVSIQAQIINLLTELQEERGLSYLFISHDLRVVRHISDRVAVMYLGKLIEVAGSDELYRSPFHPYTVALLTAVPEIGRPSAAFMGKIKGEVASALAPPPGCAFHPRCPYRMPVCSGEEPMLQEAAPGHRVACWLYD
jgi:peptide/nickel transport system ATP-binding protein/oligopeptide transport system ATP-binding protein